MEKTDSVTGEGTERGNMLQEIRERLREESQNQSAYFPRNPYWEPTKEEMANEMREIDARAIVEFAANNGRRSQGGEQPGRIVTPSPPAASEEGHVSGPPVRAQPTGKAARMSKKINDQRIKAWMLRQRFAIPTDDQINGFPFHIRSTPLTDRVTRLHLGCELSRWLERQQEKAA